MSLIGGCGGDPQGAPDGSTGGGPSSGGSPTDEASGGAVAGGSTGPGGSDGSGGAAAGGTGGTPPDPNRARFTNPLNKSHGSDPWMVYHEGYYYLAATTWGDSLTMKRGRTIAELKAATPQVIWKDTTAARCCNMWAPEFFLIDGPNGKRWYHYYTAGNGSDLGTQRSYVLESEGLDPMGPYHFKGQLLNYWAIDGSILEHAGKRYFLFSAWQGPTQNVYIIQMSSPWAVVGDRTLLTAPTYPWEQEGSDSVNEGPEVLRHDGRLFVTFSASQCGDPGYKLGQLELTGADPLEASDWSKKSVPVFRAGGSAYGTGHNGFFKSPDGSQDWLVYHATTNPAGSCWTDRTTRIQPIEWNSDGTPNFGTPIPLDTEILVPPGEPEPD
ncbi:MAG TPA: glycoside hydrolase family 43 protein [Polyangiaceae bacterium]|nr:glycoside hydrolase family 43 protein [Polyangiaceae bacterium]